LGFFEAFRVEGGGELRAEFFGGEALFVGKDGDLGGDFMASGIETRFGFAGFGLRTGGALGVGAVGSLEPQSLRFAVKPSKVA
jgi:hypothetical protein